MRAASLEDLGIEFDEYGFMVDLERWNDVVAQVISDHMGVGKLTEDHWSVLRYAREHCLKNHQPIWMEHICRTLALGEECIHRLFRGPHRGVQDRRHA
jgi:sulfur relay (sulfurtransferase) DsrC/TusE family protein